MREGRAPAFRVCTMPLVLDAAPRRDGLVEEGRRRLSLGTRQPLERPCALSRREAAGVERYLASSAAQFNTNVIGSPPACDGSRTKKREPSALTSYCGTFGDGLRPVLKSGTGNPEAG